VLELGSGCGLVGLLAAALGAHTMLTDLPSVLVSPMLLVPHDQLAHMYMMGLLKTTPGKGIWRTIMAGHGAGIRCLPVVQALLRSNAAANAEAISRTKGAVEVAELTWGQPLLPAGWEQPDIVLAADLVRGIIKWCATGRSMDEALQMRLPDDERTP
jgi:Lysine methyltransferase